MQLEGHNEHFFFLLIEYMNLPSHEITAMVKEIQRENLFLVRTYCFGPSSLMPDYFQIRENIFFFFKLLYFLLFYLNPQQNFELGNICMLSL